MMKNYIAPIVRRILCILILLVVGLSTAQAQQKQADNSDLFSQAIEQRATQIIQKMTLEEKVGQMTQITLDVLGKGDSRYASDRPLTLDKQALKKAIVDYHVGSVLNTANNRALPREKWYQIISQIQQTATGNTRLGIPVLYGIDSIHGATYTAGATMFPQQIAMAASRNRELVRRAAEITAYETRASGIPWTFSPVLDLGADPRFPRLFETFGADPYLAAELGREMIDGYEGQHNSIGSSEHVAATMKHFLGYQVPASGKDRTPASISDNALREYHLPPFKAAVEAGAHTVMVNSGIINGVPVHASKKILTDLLKKKLGFEGLVVTDWGDIQNLHTRDKVASTTKEAIKMAINAGIDMSMVPYQYEEFADKLVELVKEGKVPESRINDAVGRILKVKLALDLFEQPVTNYKNYPKFGSEQFKQTSYAMAAESITLLKNKGNLLPLSKDQNVLVTGPNANSMRTLNGAWTYSWQGDKVDEFADQYNTILEAIKKKIGAPNVTYVPGVQYDNNGQYYAQHFEKLDQAVAQAKQADVVVMCLGENTATETPGNLSDLSIAPEQTELARKVAATGTPVVLVLNEGRPRIIRDIESQMRGIVQIYQPGNFGGDALASMLFGDITPSGKLPYNYPRYPNSLVGYIHKPSEQQQNGQGMYNYSASYNPQFEFGDGLSYTTFRYKGLTLSEDTLRSGGQLTVSVEVTNTGDRPGKETVELYTSDLYASSITPDVKRLRRFRKIKLQPGESRNVAFQLNASDLEYANHNGEMIIENGRFKVTIEDETKQFEYLGSNDVAEMK